MNYYQKIVILSCLTFLLGLKLIFTPILSSNQDNLNYQSVVLIRGGEKDSSRDNFLWQRKKYDMKFHRHLEEYFPDWQNRIKYESYQFKFYESGMKKLRETRRLRIDSLEKVLSSQEKDAIDYFKGTGSYEKYQQPSVKPNIYDTRRSFLLKMHDPKLRRDFLNSYNKFN